MVQQATRPRARELNELIRYTMWSVFRVTDRAVPTGGVGWPPTVHDSPVNSVSRDVVAAELTELLGQAADKGTVTRGCYDVQGLRAGADYMFWWVAPSSDDLQEIYARFRRTLLGRASEPIWSVMALNEYEWILAFEADELHRIVDLMRQLRGAETRRHTRAEIPFFTGHRKPVRELVAALP